jgi:NADPH:quinone reductase-like Zn-dependent oxidoreductase
VRSGGVSFEQATSLPIAGLAALRVGGPLLGRQVLVTGATGGVGQFAVQLAVAAGANVTAQLSQRERQDEARALARTTSSSRWTTRASGRSISCSNGVGAPILEDAVHRLAPGATAGRTARSAGPPNWGSAISPRLPAARSWAFSHSYPEDTKDLDLAGLVADGRLEPRLGLVPDWEQTHEALDALRKRDVRGKAVLRR